MRKDKETAKLLRLQGKSYGEIIERLGVPPSILSGWFGKEDWSTAIRQRLTAAIQEKHTVRIVQLNKIRGENLARVYEEARKEARDEFELLKYSPLFIAGLMLYWGEGDKAGKDKVRLTNTDAEMISLFVLFLRQVLNIPESKIQGHILIYPDLNDIDTRAHWARSSGLPNTNFSKSTLTQGRHKTKRLGHGVCMIFCI